MSSDGVLARLGLWRLTRNPVAKGLYDRLADAGVRFARLDRYEREATLEAGDLVRARTVDEIRVRRARRGIPDALAADPLAPDDFVLTAVRDDRIIGYCCLGNRPVFVPELERRVAFPGAYVWRVYVDPGERGRGVGTSIVAHAVHVAGTTLAAPTVSALVAPDNVPSRRAFARLGFEPRDRYTTVGFRGSTRTWQGTAP